MPFITTSDGLELHYEVEGEGIPLVFTHGNMGFGRQFVLQTRIFRRTYQATTVNAALDGPPFEYCDRVI